MTSLDWLITAFVGLVAVYGYGQGFIVGALSLGGFALGALLGARVGPGLLGEGPTSPYAPLFALCGALLVGGALSLALQALGLHVRHRLFHLPGLNVVDGLAGALLTGALALGIAWVAGAVALQTPGARSLRDEIQRSAVLRELNAILPPSGPLLNALARFDPFPRVSGPPVALPAPRAAVARDREVRTGARSVVRVLGTACGLGIEGSGWVAGPGLVVTNAHVVAGQRDTVVEAGGVPPRLPAQAVAFDPRNDVAILRVSGLKRPALALAAHTPVSAPAAIVGYPENGPLDVRPGRVGATQTVISQDAYGRGPIRRSVTAVRGLIRSGNSGGPMIDPDGRVVTTLFAATTSAGPRGGYGVPNELVRRDLARMGGRVSTGPCAT